MICSRVNASRRAWRRSSPSRARRRARARVIISQRICRRGVHPVVFSVLKFSVLPCRAVKSLPARPREDSSAASAHSSAFTQITPLNVRRSHLKSMEAESTFLQIARHMVRRAAPFSCDAAPGLPSSPVGIQALQPVLSGALTIGRFAGSRRRQGDPGARGTSSENLRHSRCAFPCPLSSVMPRRTQHCLPNPDARLAEPWYAPHLAGAPSRRRSPRSLSSTRPRPASAWLPPRGSRPSSRRWSSTRSTQTCSWRGARP